MNTRVATVTAILAVFIPTSVMAEELRSTHELVVRAKRQQQEQQPEEQIQPGEYEFHFRKVGESVLFCAHVALGNGGFCTKVGRRYVAQVDRAAAEFCREQPNEDPPHAIYGEAYDVHYTCKGSRMTRLPYSYGFDEEGYVRSQWRVLR
jgi:hypothetical protein